MLSMMCMRDRQRLLDMGLRPDTAFGCAARFLFEPQPAVRELFAEEIDRLSDPAALKIGIQIRTNDDAFKAVGRPTFHHQ
jgi:hypothetical protein